jgi:hypothetical protein
VWEHSPEKVHLAKELERIHARGHNRPPIERMPSGDHNLNNANLQLRSRVTNNVHCIMAISSEGSSYTQHSVFRTGSCLSSLKDDVPRTRRPSGRLDVSLGRRQHPARYSK